MSADPDDVAKPSSGISEDSQQVSKAHEELPKLKNEEHDDGSQSWAAGFYYQDVSGETQGPYSAEHMHSLAQQWPETFIPSMQLWFTDGLETSGMVRLEDICNMTVPASHQSNRVEEQQGKAASSCSNQDGALFKEYADAVLAGMRQAH
jgi:hypothetical protein